jgi:hypothetical protein
MVRFNIWKQDEQDVKDIYPGGQQTSHGSLTPSRKARLWQLGQAPIELNKIEI